MTTIDMANTDMWVGVYPDGQVPYLFFGQGGTPTSALDQGELIVDREEVDNMMFEWNPEMASYEISHFSADEKKSVLYGYGSGEGQTDTEYPTTTEVFIHTPMEKYFANLVNQPDPVEVD